MTAVACAGFILAGAEKKFRRGRKKIRGGRLAKKNSAPPVFFSAPPAEFNSAPGAEQTKGGGQKTLLYLEKEGETFNDRSLSNPQLTVLFFL